MRIEVIWEQLEEESCNSLTGYLTRRIMPELFYCVYLSVERPSNTRGLMLRIHKQFSKSKIILESKNFFVQRIILEQDKNSEYVTIYLSLNDKRFEDFFSILVEDIISHLNLIPQEGAAFKAFCERLKRWQSFLEKHGSNSLTMVEQQGLYGELWFLKQLAIPSLGESRGIRAWTGPKATQQDFQFVECAVEVKTTSAKQHQKLTIASERQLDDTGTGTIVLLHLSLDVRQGQGETLPAIVANIRALVADDTLAKDELESCLFEVGYLDIHASRYEEIAYSIREHNYFKVENDFPRIIESDLRNGVGDVRYTISVAECKRFSIPASEVITLIGGQS